MGGEKLSAIFQTMGLPGSPPRGRGKAPPWTAERKRGRITPAWAGKSSWVEYFAALSQDHPRVGGEKDVELVGALLDQGSPPRGRGKALALRQRPRARRITPAWAGKSIATVTASCVAKDHPRVGGEKRSPMPDSPMMRGSPPRGRGKAPVVSVGNYIAGITPAWAGKRLKRSHRSGIFISGPIPFHSVLHRPAGSGGSRAGRDGSPAGQPQNTGPA